MNADRPAMAVHPHRPALSNDPDRRPLRWWRVFAAMLVAAVFLEAVFAGAILSGIVWARSAHAVTAALLIVSTLAAGLVSILTLRRIPQGLKLGLTLLALAAGLILQAAVGALSAKGANLLWVHVPLGVALVGFATQAAVSAGRLGENDGLRAKP
jgi:hypothetical protein